MLYKHLLQDMSKVKETRILWFLTFALAIFTEYTMWAALRGNIRYLICALTITRHMGITWVYYYLHAVLFTLAYINSGHLPLLLLANENKYANEVHDMHIDNNRTYGHLSALLWKITQKVGVFENSYSLCSKLFPKILHSGCMDFIWSISQQAGKGKGIWLSFLILNSKSTRV